MGHNTSVSFTITTTVNGAVGTGRSFSINTLYTITGGVCTGSSPVSVAVGSQGGGDSATFNTAASVVATSGQTPGPFSCTIQETINAGGTGAALSAGTSATLNVTVIAADTTPPTVSSSVRAGGAPALTNASSVDFTVTFSESVTGVDTTDFTLTTTGTIASASVTSVSAGPGTTRTVTVNTGTGDGTIRLDVTDDDTILDLASNKLGGTGTGNGNFTTGEAYTLDRTPPTVSSRDRKSVV